MYNFHLLYYIILFNQQLEHANANKKNLFENVNTDWGLPSVPMEDILTDFSDEDIIDEKVSLYS